MIYYIWFNTYKSHSTFTTTHWAINIIWYLHTLANFKDSSSFSIDFSTPEIIVTTTSSTMIYKFILSPNLHIILCVCSINSIHTSSQTFANSVFSEKIHNPDKLHLHLFKIYYFIYSKYVATVDFPFPIWYDSSAFVLNNVFLSFSEYITYVLIPSSWHVGNILIAISLLLAAKHIWIFLFHSPILIF